MRGSLELALPPGTARYARVDVTAEKHLSLSSVLPLRGLEGVVASWCGSFGTARLLDLPGSTCASQVNLTSRYYTSDGQRKQLHMSDRFFLGGPMSLRGFHLYGAGPRGTAVTPTRQNDMLPMLRSGDLCGVDDDALGGMTRVVGMLGLSAPLPFKFTSSENVRTFIFANYGALLPHSMWPLVPIAKSLSLQEAISPFRVSIGCGVSYSLGPARLELTYALPVRMARHDVIKPFQIGIGLSMNT